VAVIGCGAHSLGGGFGTPFYFQVVLLKVRGPDIIEVGETAEPLR
jgi:hypothetical protein